MKTVFVLVDALKNSYLSEENMPFLFRFANENLHVNRIIPSPGFCERCEIFSGLRCYDTGNFTAIGFDPLRGYYRNSQLVLKLASSLAKFTPKTAKGFLRKYRDIKGIPLKPYRITFRTLKNYILTEDGKHQYINYDTIFDLLDKNGLSYTLDGFTALSDIGKKHVSDYAFFLRQKLDSGMDFVPIYIGKIDAMGHKYGKDIENIRPYLKEVDRTLSQFYEISNEFEARFCVLGDHGMIPVEKRVDLANELRPAGFVEGRLYEMFLDSTLSRFWFTDNKIREKMQDFLTNHLGDFGYCITEDMAEKYGIPMDIKGKDGSNVYGELIWAAFPGILISPDFFHASYPLINGMHGYIDLEYSNGMGLFCSNQNKNKYDEKYLYEVVEFLCESLDISIPNRNNWRRKKND